MRAAFFLGHGLNKRQCRAPGFSNGRTPCHATLTETLRVIDAGTLADDLGAACPVESGDPRHIGIDGKSNRSDHAPRNIFLLLAFTRKVLRFFQSV